MWKLFTVVLDVLWKLLQQRMDLHLVPSKRDVPVPKFSCCCSSCNMHTFRDEQMRKKGREVASKARAKTLGGSERLRRQEWYFSSGGKGTLLRSWGVAWWLTKHLVLVLVNKASGGTGPSFPTLLRCSDHRLTCGSDHNALFCPWFLH